MKRAAADDANTAAGASPCINVCVMDEASGWCRGCLRTIGEIAGWAAMSDDDRRAVWRLLPARRLAWRQLRRAEAQPGPAR